MKYDEKEELEATGEWLLRINKAGFSEELDYVPSQLAKLGVAPSDVVDRLDWLRGGRGSIEASPQSGQKVIEGQVVRSAIEEQTTPVMVLENFEPPMVGCEIALDYAPWEWEWVGKIESVIEESVRAILDPEPGLEVFNELSSSVRRRKGRKRAMAIASMRKS